MVEEELVILLCSPVQIAELGEQCLSILRFFHQQQKNVIVDLSDFLSQCFKNPITSYSLKPNMWVMYFLHRQI